jgi:5'-3' exonuclease
MGRDLLLQDVRCHNRRSQHFSTCSATQRSVFIFLSTVYSTLYPSGLKLLDTGAFVKDCEGADREIEQAAQMTLSEVASEDPSFAEKDAPPLSEEFPEGSKILFLGEHAYGVAAQVSATKDTMLALILAVRDSRCLSPKHLPLFMLGKLTNHLNQNIA